MPFQANFVMGGKHAKKNKFYLSPLVGLFTRFGVHASRLRVPALQTRCDATGSASSCGFDGAGKILGASKLRVYLKLDKKQIWATFPYVLHLSGPQENLSDMALTGAVCFCSY